MWLAKCPEDMGPKDYNKQPSIIEMNKSLKTLFGGLVLETAGLVWDVTKHLGGRAEGEGLIEPSHLVIFAGFVLSFIGAVLVYRAYQSVTQ